MASFPLSKDDEDLLARCRKIARDIADSHGADKARPLDVPALQRLVDDEVCDPDDDWSLQSLGVAFGDLLCRSGFHWAASETQERRNLVVAWRDTGLMISAPVLIQKRVSAGEDCDIAALESWALGLASEKDKP